MIRMTKFIELRALKLNIKSKQAQGFATGLPAQAND